MPVQPAASRRDGVEAVWLAWMALPASSRVRIAIELVNVALAFEREASGAKVASSGEAYREHACAARTLRELLLAVDARGGLAGLAKVVESARSAVGGEVSK